MGADHFAAELQLDDDQQIAKVCEALELSIVQDAQQPLIQIPKKVQACRFHWQLYAEKCNALAPCRSQ